MNKVILTGRLGTDVEPITNGVKFNLATNEYNGKEEVTLWTRVVVFDKQAELCQQYVKKGSLVLVEGRLSSKKSQEGTYSTSVVAGRVEFLSLAKD